MTEELELTNEERALLAAGEQETAPVVSEIPTDPEPPVARPRAKKAKAADELVEEQPTTGNPEIPAQWSYDEGPWGLLPVQMRHDVDGNPVH